ncbi:MAG: hypothetical protein A3H25_01825 [Sphingomonadales bacterium RIFCSPLOWO2_12_FULL_63_15]|nr:MAG: hypothetical protein A3H25_01825 [Sphingomonadales bacterium RIFCSPLOWO2_12_FULL_63_15]
MNAVSHIYYSSRPIRPYAPFVYITASSSQTDMAIGAWTKIVKSLSHKLCPEYRRLCRIAAVTRFLAGARRMV